MTGRDMRKRVEELEREVAGYPHREKEFCMMGGVSNALLNASITANFLLDSTGTIVAANKTFAQSLGKSEATDFAGRDSV